MEYLLPFLLHHVGHFVISKKQKHLISEHVSTLISNYVPLKMTGVKDRRFQISAIKAEHRNRVQREPIHNLGKSPCVSHLFMDSTSMFRMIGWFNTPVRR